MLFIALLGIGLGLLGAIVVGMVMFVSVAFGSELCEQTTTGTDDAPLIKSGNRALQVVRDSQGCTVIAVS